MCPGHFEFFCWKAPGWEVERVEVVALGCNFGVLLMVFVNVALTLLNCLLALPSCFDPEQRCLNGGVCVKQNRYKADSAVCFCPAGYGGETCEKIVNLCEVFPRYCNAGTCININGSAVCYCPAGYFGQNCEYTFDKCKLGNICRNGGTCAEDICFCLDGFSGELCERHVPERDDYSRGGCEEHPEFCALRFADGVCNKECDDAKCFFDGFDCVANTQKCKYADYCALHYMDGKCDKICAVAECGYDGMDCDKNINFRYLTDSSTIGIIFEGSSAEVLQRMYSLLAKLAQKLHNPVRLALDSSNGSRIYEWSFEFGIGKKIDLREGWKVSRNATGILLYVDIDAAFCERRLDLNKTNTLPCFTDVFGATAYLHTALYDVAKDRLSLDDVRIEELFVENERSRSLTFISVVVAFFLFFVIAFSCIYGIHGFWDILRKRSVKKNHAPVWNVPPSSSSNITGWSVVSSSEECQLKKDTNRPGGLPPLSRRFSSSASCGRKQSSDFACRSELAEYSGQQTLVNFDSYLDDNGDAECYLGPNLLKAVKCNDVKAVSFLVLHGADVNCSDSDGNTALHHAVMVNSDQIIRVLLNSHRCNVSLRAVNILGQTALTLTVKFAHVSESCARCILDFIYAEHHRHTKSPTSTFVPHQYALLPRNGISQSMFITAGSDHQFDSSLFQQHLGSHSSDCLFYRNILSERDDPTLTDVFGRTALHYAALNNRTEVAPRLYAFGLKLNTQDNKGETPLYLAAREGHLDMVDLLLTFGANRNITDQLGRKPLDVAREREQHAVVGYLENGTTDGVDIMQALKRKRKNQKQSDGEARCKPQEEYQTLIASSQETASLSSSSITIKMDDFCVRDVGGIDRNAVTSDSPLNSAPLFVLTPPEQILAEAEKETNLTIFNPVLSDCADLTTNPRLAFEFSQEYKFIKEPFQVDESDEASNDQAHCSGKSSAMKHGSGK